MKNPEDRNNEISKGEDEISAAKTDVNATEKPADDGFKTSKDHKHRLSWEVPHDEQMFDNTSPAADENEEKRE